MDPSHEEDTAGEAAVAAVAAAVAATQAGAFVTHDAGYVSWPNFGWITIGQLCTEAHNCHPPRLLEEGASNSNGTTKFTRLG